MEESLMNLIKLEHNY